MKYPLLRRDIRPVNVMVEGRRMLAFMDPLRLAQTGYAVDARLTPLLALLDGSNDFKDIQTGLMRYTGGTVVPVTALESFVAQLDKYYLLESEMFIRRKNELVDEFSRLSEREPHHAGASYHADPEELLRFFEETESELPPLDAGNTGDIAGILAPHIDITVARHAYVDAYRRIRGREYELVIIFGINHNGYFGQDSLYSLTGKDFVTPLGRLSTDREFISSLKHALPEGAVSLCDFDHKLEHSIEFQTVFLAHYPAQGARIVPVLCNGIHGFLQSQTDPFTDRRFLAFRDAMSELISRQKGKVLLVAGVDFSHVGRKFGQAEPMDDLLPAAQANDRLLIDLLAECSGEGIFHNALALNDQYNVCGLSSMIMFASLLKYCRGDLLHHGTYEEPATDSAVTYASMVFTRES